MYYWKLHILLHGLTTAAESVVLQVHELWLHNTHTTYPATLYVTLRAVTLDSVELAEQPTRRSMAPLQQVGESTADSFRCYSLPLSSGGWNPVL